MRAWGKTGAERARRGVEIDIFIVRRAWFVAAINISSIFCGCSFNFKRNWSHGLRRRLGGWGRINVLVYTLRVVLGATHDYNALLR